MVNVERLALIKIYEDLEGERKNIKLLALAVVMPEPILIMLASRRIIDGKVIRITEPSTAVIEAGL